jgi:2-keto-4-pentenoate hydratase/2-oxohepta-3-ene-1,7-dioic acid hydratase in catechol pathway
VKLGRYQDACGRERVGAVLGHGAQLRVLDLAAATAAHGRSEGPFASMDALMQGGKATLEAAAKSTAWAVREGEASWFTPEPQVRWLTPVAPRNVIAGGMNFARHRDEVIRVNGKGASHSDFPMGFIKLAQCMVPTRSDVERPRGVVQFDYEIEVAAVIGRDARDVDEGRALDAVFGYTVMNDLSARELQLREMANQSILIGKNFPGFGPLGPWILTADEVPDPSVLGLELRVNGEVRQRSTCADLIFGFAPMVAHWSRMGLVRGDVITTGTPEGIALAQRPDPTPFFLKPGDIVEAEVVQIGVLQTRIVGHASMHRDR